MNTEASKIKFWFVKNKMKNSNTVSRITYS